MKSYVIKIIHGICYQVYCKDEKLYNVYSDKRDVFYIESVIKDGDIFRVGYPNIHNVYRVSKDGTLNFQYHYTKGLENVRI